MTFSVKVHAFAACRARLRIKHHDPNIWSTLTEVFDVVVESLVTTVSNSIEQPNLTMALHRNHPVQHAEQRRNANTTRDKYYRLGRRLIQAKISPRRKHVDNVSFKEPVVNDVGCYT